MLRLLHFFAALFYESLLQYICTNYLKHITVRVMHRCIASRWRAHQIQWLAQHILQEPWNILLHLLHPLGLWIVLFKAWSQTFEKVLILILITYPCPCTKNLPTINNMFSNGIRYKSYESINNRYRHPRAGAWMHVGNMDASVNHLCELYRATILLSIMVLTFKGQVQTLAEAD